MLNWKEATLSQLYEIAYHDKECATIYKQQAIDEIRRRQERRRISTKPIARQHAPRPKK